MASCLWQVKGGWWYVAGGRLPDCLGANCPHLVVLYHQEQELEEQYSQRSMFCSLRTLLKYLQFYVPDWNLRHVSIAISPSPHSHHREEAGGRVGNLDWTAYQLIDC